MIPITRCSSIQGVWGQRGEKGSFQLASVLEECNSCLQLSFMFSFLYFCSLLNRTCVEKGPYSQNYGFTSSRTWIWELDHKEGWPLKYWCFRTVVLEMILESPFTCKEIKSLHSKGNQSWIFIGRTDAEAEAPILWPRCEELTHSKRPWCWERLKAGEGDDRGWDGWMASPTQWTWVWVSSRSWWWTGRPGMLQSMGLQRVGHNWATELNW